MTNQSVIACGKTWRPVPGRSIAGVWTLDKFVAVDHATSVFSKFYFLNGLGASAIYAIGVVELVIVIAFVLGIAKRFSYGAVFLFHAVSTLASFPMYLNPAEGRLFFAAWPMLAACFALYLLRESDTMFTASRVTGR